MPQSSSLLPFPLRWAGPFLAVGYGLGARIHRALSTPRHAQLPVICLGNLTVGGTGKTPAAKYFARGLAQRVRKPAILMRGYKGQADDEAVEVESALADIEIPVIVGADRLASVARAKDEGCDVALLDDGFQHWRLARDLDVILVDATSPFGGGHLVPWGRLRERPEALARAGVVILTRSDMLSADELAALERTVAACAPQAVLSRARHKPVCLRTVPKGQTRPLEELRGAKVNALCGIGNPDAFRRTLEQLGAHVTDMLVYPDHHNYTKAEAEALQDQAGDALLVTTAKDAAKLARFMPVSDDSPLHSLDVDFVVTKGEDAMWIKVVEALAAADKRLEPMTDSEEGAKSQELRAES